MTHTTELYTVPIAAYIKEEAGRRLAALWWIPAVAALALAIAGAFDSRYIYLCLMVVLIVYPMALSLCWLAIAARPEMSILTRPQHIDVLHDGMLRLCFHAFRSDSDDTPAVLASIDLPASCIAQAERQRRFICVKPLGDNSLSLKYILIPLEISDGLYGQS